MESKDVFLSFEKEVAEFKLRLIQKLSEGSLIIHEQRSRRTSKMSLVQDVLRKAGKPLHVNEIISAVKNEYNVDLERDSLSSALNKKTRKEERFTRVAPNTFELRQD